MTPEHVGHFGQRAHPRVHEDPVARLTPTIIITNDHEMTTRNLIRQCARRMTIEQRLAEIIRVLRRRPDLRHQPHR